jgi:branched-chain amino acid transport system ATP-binding protein
VSAPRCLRAQALAAGYGDVRAVWDVSLATQPGQVLAMFGPNGAGKTTTLRALAGLIRPDAGQIWLDDRDITGLDPVRRSRIGIGYVEEGKRIFRQRSVEENLRLGGCGIKGRRQLRENIDRQYALFPALAKLRDQRAGSLSGGQQQMLAIGQALVAEPGVLLLDEPSAGLAPMIIADILAVIRGLADAGLAVLLVEQLASQSLAIADRVIVVERGRVVHSGGQDDTPRVVGRDLARAPAGPAAPPRGTAPSREAAE